MSKTLKRILESLCIGSFLLAVLCCENADGTLNVAWTVPMLAVSGITGAILKKSEHQNQ